MIGRQLLRRIGAGRDESRAPTAALELIGPLQLLVNGLENLVRTAYLDGVTLGASGGFIGREAVADAFADNVKFVVANALVAPLNEMQEREGATIDDLVHDAYEAMSCR